MRPTCILYAVEQPGRCLVRMSCDSLLDPAWELSVLPSSDCGAYSLQDEQASVHKINPVPGSATCEDSSDEEYESRCTKIHAQPAKRPRQGNQSHPGHDAKSSHAPGQAASMHSAACVCDWICAQCTGYVHCSDSDQHTQRSAGANHQLCHCMCYSCRSADE